MREIFRDNKILLVQKVNAQLISIFTS